MLVPDSAKFLPEHTIARCLRLSAHGLSLSRLAGGLALGWYIGTNEYPLTEWWPSVAATGLVATDAADGFLARQATKRDGRTSHFGRWVDQMMDKVFTTSVLTGIAVASFTQNRPMEGTVLAASATVMSARDIWITRRRAQAEKQAQEQDIALNSGAQWPGKFKMAVLSGAIIAETSPLMEVAPANWAANAAVAGATVLSVTSAYSLNHSLQDQLSIAQPIPELPDSPGDPDQQL